MEEEDLVEDITVFIAPHVSTIAVVDLDATSFSSTEGMKPLEDSHVVEAPLPGPPFAFKVISRAPPHFLQNWPRRRRHLYHMLQLLRTSP